MKTTNILLSGSAIVAACLLVAPRDSQAYAYWGYVRPITQRDVLVYDNFTMASANNNTNPDANWPGYTGVELAIWKGCAEWASELHGGDGKGDPTQLVGSGGANFDITWQGNTTIVGGITNNINSMIGGSSGGVLAFTYNQPGGYQIRYYQGWAWQDGPGAVFSGVDVQGVACHEYGHALGLGHTNVGGATMYPSISGAGTGARSIQADDIAGLQARYGAKSPTKPSITGISLAGGNITITGVNFSPTNNQVWFTQAGTAFSGNPIKVNGVTSNGTSITVVIPAAAGPGDVLVRNDGGSHANLSNAWPVDPASGFICGATIYCTGKVSSTGNVSMINWNGSPSWGAGNFEITNFNGGVANTFGIHIYSNTGPDAKPFANGTLCLASPIFRGPLHQYGPFGVVTVPIPIDLSQIGARRLYQFWFRDTQHPDGTGVGLSDGLDVTFCP